MPFELDDGGASLEDGVVGASSLFHGRRLIDSDRKSAGNDNQSSEKFKEKSRLLDHLARLCRWLVGNSLCKSNI